MLINMHKLDASADYLQKALSLAKILGSNLQLSDHVGQSFQHLTVDTIQLNSGKQRLSVS